MIVLQQASVMEHIDDLGYSVQLIGWYIQPCIERFNHLSPNIFARDRTNMSKGL